MAEVLGLKNVSHEDLSRHHCVDWLKAHEAHFSRARTMETADLTIEDSGTHSGTSQASNEHSPNQGGNSRTVESGGEDA